MYSDQAMLNWKFSWISGTLAPYESRYAILPEEAQKAGEGLPTAQNHSHTKSIQVMLQRYCPADNVARTRVSKKTISRFPMSRSRRLWPAHIVPCRRAPSQLTDWHYHESIQTNGVYVPISSHREDFRQKLMAPRHSWKDCRSTMGWQRAAARLLTFNPVRTTS